MANRRCPSCGQSYNGKRCKNCFYEPFGDVRPSFELHPVRPPVPHREPPLRPIPRKQPKKSSPGKAILQRLGILWAVMLVTTVILPMVFEVFENVGSSFEVAAPEPIPLPADGIVLYEDADIQVIADWDGETPVEGDIPIFVENFGNEDRIVCTDGVSINGCMVDEAFFYCDAYRNSVSKATMWIDMEVLQKLGFQEVRYLKMAIDVMDEDYNMIMDDAIFDTGGTYVHEIDNSGLILYDQDGFRLVYQGYECSNGNTLLYLYGENNTSNTLELSSNELLIDDKETGIWIFQKFLPGGKRIFYAFLTDFVIPDGDVLAEVDLFLSSNANATQESYLGTFNFHLN